MHHTYGWVWGFQFGCLSSYIGLIVTKASRTSSSLSQPSRALTLITRTLLQQGFILLETSQSIDNV